MADDWGPPSQVAQVSDAGWGAPSPPPSDDGWGSPVGETKRPRQPDAMPGILDAVWQGLKQGTSDVGQTATSFSTTAPVPAESHSPAAAPLEWADLIQPQDKLAPKVGYRLGASYPMLATGVAGGLAGSAAAGPIGGLAGGVTGSALGAALQTIGPVFAEELKKAPGDPEGAWTRSLESAAISAGGAGAGWALFPLKVPGVSGALKQLAFQAFGVQPAVAVAEKGIHNIHEGKPITEGLGQAYGEGAVMSAVPALGHKIIEGGLGGKAALPPEPRTPLQDTLFNSGTLKLQHAESFERAASASTNSTTQLSLREQARALSEDGQHEIALSNIPPDVKERGKIRQGFIDTFMPDAASDKALQIDARVGRFKSTLAHINDAILGRAEKFRYEWNKVPEADKDRFWNAYETGNPVPADLATRFPWMPGREASYRKYLFDSYIQEKELNSRADYLQNYFPHIWKDPEKAQKVINNAGPTFFQKERFYDLITEGKRHGLELVSDNPEHLVAMRLMSGADMMQKVKLLRELNAEGVAFPKDKTPPDLLNPRRGSPNPWQEIKAPNGEAWMLAPDAQMLWKNGVEAKGLWASPDMAGDVFRGWMSIKNAWVPIKLGLSLFHPIHVQHINISNNLARAWKETTGKGDPNVVGRLKAIPEAVVQSVFDTFLAYPWGVPFTKMRLPSSTFIGKEVREAWLTNEADKTPRQKELVKTITEAGISGQLSEQLRVAAKQGLSEAWRNNRYLGVLGHGARRAIEKATGPIFEQWIPNLKAAAVHREAEALFRRRPELINDEKNRLIAMRAIGKQVDNRFGEMFYGSLFWNRTVKDAAIGSFLSLGWNLGFVREFLGGALEPAVKRLGNAPTPTRALIRDVTSKSTNVVLYTSTAMIFNAIVNKSMTGDNPEGMDYVFPRIGGNNPDGSPRRISNPFYTREVPMAFKNIEERQSVPAGLAQMLSHKLMFGPFTEMASNRNYFGYQIYDENAPGFKQMYQFGKHLLTEQLNPMSIAGAKRALELSGKPHSAMDILKGALTGEGDVWAPIAGFGPAPAYASKDAIDNRIGYLFTKYGIAHERPFQEAEVAKQRSEARTAYMMAVQRKDQPAIAEAAQKLAALGVKNAQIQKIQPGGNIQYMFQRLPESQQIDLLKRMDAEKFKKFYPKANKKTKADQGVVDLAQRYYGNRD